MENFFRYVRLTEGEGGEEVEVTAFLLLSSPHTSFRRLPVCSFTASSLVSTFNACYFAFDSIRSILLCFEKMK